MNRLDSLLGLGFQFSDAILYSDERVISIVERVGNHTKADKKKAEVGHVACRMSHRIAIEAAEVANEETTLILEGIFNLLVLYFHYHHSPIIIDHQRKLI